MSCFTRQRPNSGMSVQHDLFVGPDGVKWVHGGQLGNEFEHLGDFLFRKGDARIRGSPVPFLGWYRVA